MFHLYFRSSLQDLFTYFSLLYTCNRACWFCYVIFQITFFLFHFLYNSLVLRDIYQMAHYNCILKELVFLGFFLYEYKAIKLHGKFYHTHYMDHILLSWSNSSINIAFFHFIWNFIIIHWSISILVHLFYCM